MFAFLGDECVIFCWVFGPTNLLDYRHEIKLSARLLFSSEKSTKNS